LIKIVRIGFLFLIKTKNNGLTKKQRKEVNKIMKQENYEEMKVPLDEIIDEVIFLLEQNTIYEIKTLKQFNELVNIVLNYAKYNYSNDYVDNLFEQKYELYYPSYETTSIIDYDDWEDEISEKYTSYQSNNYNIWEE
jgi:hypothetical protein